MWGDSNDADIERVWWSGGAAYHSLFVMWIITRFAEGMVADNAGFTPFNVVMSLLPFALVVAVLRWVLFGLVLHGDSSLTLRYLGRRRRLQPNDVDHAFVSKGGGVIIKVGGRSHALPVAGDDSHALVARLLAARTAEPSPA